MVKTAIVVVGDISSGKTTSMRDLMQKTPLNKRILAIEDVPELFLPTHLNNGDTNGRT